MGSAHLARSPNFIGIVSHRPSDPVVSFRIISTTPSKSHKASGLKVPTPSHVRQHGRVSLSYWGASWPHFHCKAFLTYQHRHRFKVSGARTALRIREVGVNTTRHVCKLSATAGSQLAIFIVLWACLACETIRRVRQVRWTR